MEMNEKLLPLAEALERVVREAGALARDAFGTRIRTWVKEHNSPVSEIDLLLAAPGAPLPHCARDGRSRMVNRPS